MGKCASERLALEKKQNKMGQYLDKMKGQPVTIENSFAHYFYLEYYHEGQEDECFVCGLEKEDVIEREYKEKDVLQEMDFEPKYMNVPAVLKELEKMEMIHQADGVYCLDHAFTANQKVILKAFGIDAAYVKNKSRDISDRQYRRKYLGSKGEF